MQSPCTCPLCPLSFWCGQVVIAQLQLYFVFWPWQRCQLLRWEVGTAGQHGLYMPCDPPLKAPYDGMCGCNWTYSLRQDSGEVFVFGYDGGGFEVWWYHSTPQREKGAKDVNKISRTFENGRLLVQQPVMCKFCFVSTLPSVFPIALPTHWQKGRSSSAPCHPAPQNGHRWCSANWIPRGAWLRCVVCGLGVLSLR